MPNSVWAATSCVKPPCAATCRVCARPAGNTRTGVVPRGASATDDSPGGSHELPLMRLPRRHSLKPEKADIVSGLRKAGRCFLSAHNLIDFRFYRISVHSEGCFHEHD